MLLIIGLEISTGHLINDIVLCSIVQWIQNFSEHEYLNQVIINSFFPLI